MIFEILRCWHGFSLLNYKVTCIHAVEVINAFLVASENYVALKDELRTGFEKSFQRLELFDVMSHDFDYFVRPPLQHQINHVRISNVDKDVNNCRTFEMTNRKLTRKFA